MQKKKIWLIGLMLLAHIAIPRVWAADNMCNVNPGSCSTPEDWINGWFAAREPENRDAVPQQPEYTQRNESNDSSQPPDRPVEIIRMPDEPNSTNRSQIAADDAAARGGDPVNPSTVTKDPIPLDSNLQPIQSGTGSTSGGTGDFTRQGVWGEFGLACQGSSGAVAQIGDTSGTCTGDITIHACSSPQFVTNQQGKVVPICNNPVDQKTGTVDCVAIANQRCAFVQIDVANNQGAITCYPTNCGPAPAASAPPGKNEPAPAQGATAQSEAPPENPPQQTAAPTATATPTPTPVPVCEVIRVYDTNNNDITAVIKDGSRKLTLGETIVLATTKGQATKARFRIQGIAEWAENDPTKTTDTEYRLAFQIPSTLTQTQGAFEVEVFVGDQWR